MFASAYRDGGDVGYGRWTNPTWEAFEQTLAELEGGGAALAFGSGQAAVAAVLDGLPVGARVVAPADAYLATRGLLAESAGRGLVEPVLVDATDSAAIESATVGADLLWLESPLNPLLGIVDLAAVCGAAAQRGVPVVVDNTFATPILQKPLDLGATVVVHSATKYLGGHSDLLLGAVVTRDDALADRLHQHRSMHGAVP
nr:PLP-dependent transferase [Micromonospora sp. DSM 115978]